MATTELPPRGLYRTTTKIGDCEADRLVYFHNLGVLDAILLRHVDQEQSRDEIVAAGFDAAVVDRMLRLVRISEWKRHQAAPGPKVSRRAFGRERRYPISSGYSA